MNFMFQFYFYSLFAPKAGDARSKLKGTPNSDYTFGMKIVEYTNGFALKLSYNNDI